MDRVLRESLLFLQNMINEEMMMLQVLVENLLLEVVSLLPWLVAIFFFDRSEVRYMIILLLRLVISLGLQLLDVEHMLLWENNKNN